MSQTLKGLIGKAGIALNSGYAKAGMVATTALVTTQVHATSALDAVQLAAFKTDVEDTAAEYKTFVIGIIFVLALIGLAINMTRKSTNKAGAKF